MCIKHLDTLREAKCLCVSQILDPSPFVSLLQDHKINENENMAQIGCFAHLDSKFKILWLKRKWG